jgi:hypothetical protein
MLLGQQNLEHMPAELDRKLTPNKLFKCLFVYSQRTNLFKVEISEWAQS